MVAREGDDSKGHHELGEEVTFKCAFAPDSGNNQAEGDDRDPYSGARQYVEFTATKLYDTRYGQYGKKGHTHGGTQQPAFCISKIPFQDNDDSY